MYHYVELTFLFLRYIYSNYREDNMIMFDVDIHSFIHGHIFVANILKAGFLAIPGAFYRTKSYYILNPSRRLIKLRYVACLADVFRVYMRSLNCNEKRTITSGCCNNHNFKVFLNKKRVNSERKKQIWDVCASSSSCGKVGWLLIVGLFVQFSVYVFSKILIPKLLLMYVGSTLKSLWIKASANVK